MRPTTMQRSPAPSAAPRPRRRPDLTLPLTQRDPSLAVPLHLPSPSPAPSSTVSDPSSAEPSPDPAPVPGCSPLFRAPDMSGLERVRRIGFGSSGAVWMVRHPPTDRCYALKVVYGYHDDTVRRQICREVDILLSVNSSFVVRCYGMYDHAGEIQMLLEFMDGGSLDGRRISSEQFLADIARQVLQGLAYLHGRGIVHRDIKPSNLLMNSSCQVKIADFGVSRILAQTMDSCTSSVGRLGTIAYMSPERINTDLVSGGQDGCPGDIWSFGLSILEVYLGRFPVGESIDRQDDWASLMCSICFSDPPSAPPTASPEFRSFITSCLQKDPSRRLTAAQLLEHPFITGVRTSPSPHPPPPPGLSCSDGGKPQSCAE